MRVLLPIATLLVGHMHFLFHLFPEMSEAAIEKKKWLLSLVLYSVKFLPITNI